MATSKVETRDQVRCKYYLHGACNLKSECPFSHVMKDKPSMVCTFYLKGTCTYGKQCRYDHVKPEFAAKTEKVPSAARGTMRLTQLTQLKPKAKELNIDAPVFQPGQRIHATSSNRAVVESEEASYLNAGVTNTLSHGDSLESLNSLTADEISQLMCPFAAVRKCPYGDKCHYVHGLSCDICELQCLDPLDLEQQAEHRKECLESHERNMEYSFAIQRSEDVTCSICLDVVTERENVNERRFGILENCCHSFCLVCIRKWRQSSDGAKIVKACPICRISSGFVTPSVIWIEDSHEKTKLIADYQDALSSKDCRYFDKGNGNCPFGASCFYKHAYADGKLDSREKPKIRFCEDADGNAKSVRNQSLWDFIEERDMRANEDF